MLKHVFGNHNDIESTDIFTLKNEHSYAAFIGILSNIFMKAHASSTFRTTPYNASLIITPSMTIPYNKQPESSLSRLKEIISRLKQPLHGINIGIFIGESKTIHKNTKNGIKHPLSQCWPLINDSSIKKSIITINLPPKQLNKGKNKVRYFTYEDINININENIKFIDYTTPISTVFSYLNKSKIHISYQGGTAWFSICLGIPTIIIHPNNKVDSFHQKYKLFGQDIGNINILDDKNKIIQVRHHPCEYHVNINNVKHTIRKFI